MSSSSRTSPTRSDVFSPGRRRRSVSSCGAPEAASASSSCTAMIRAGGHRAKRRLVVRPAEVVPGVDEGRLNRPKIKRISDLLGRGYGFTATPVSGRRNRWV